MMQRHWQPIVDDLRPFLRLMGPDRLWLLGGAGLALFATLSQVGLLTLSGWFITACALAGLAAPHGAIAFNFLFPAGGIRTFAVSRTAGRYAERLVSHEATFRVLARLRVWVFEAALPLSPGQLAGFRAGDLLNRLTADIDALDHLYLRILTPLAVAAIGTVTLTLFWAIFSPVIALMSLALLLIAGIALPIATERLGRAPGARITTETARLRTSLVETVSAIAEVLIYDRARRLPAAALTHAGALMQAQTQTARIAAAAQAASGLLAHLALALVLIVGALLMNAGSISGPVLVMLALSVLAAFELTGPLGPALQALGRTRAAARRLRGIAELPPAVTDPPPARARPLPEDSTLVLDGVSFTYPGAARPALNGVTLALPPGARIVVRGASGSGKSTLLHMAARFFDPDAGRVTLGGVDIRDVRLGDLWQRMALVSQRTEVFTGTVRDNLRLAAPDAPDALLEDALDRAHLLEAARGWPDGFDTQIGEQGHALSGGEAQRLVLARALLRRPAILLLDEPTEGLDEATENQVFAALDALPGGMSILLVSHRPVRQMRIDACYRMHDGYLAQD